MGKKGILGGYANEGPKGFYWTIKNTSGETRNLPLDKPTPQFRKMKPDEKVCETKFFPLGSTTDPSKCWDLMRRNTWSRCREGSYIMVKTDATDRDAKDNCMCLDEKNVNEDGVCNLKPVAEIDPDRTFYKVFCKNLPGRKEECEAQPGC